MRLWFLSSLILFSSHVSAFSSAELETLRLKSGTPALGAGIVRPDSMDIWMTGVRKLGDPTPVQKNDKFHLASNTKSMTATLLAILIEEKKISWQATLEEIFPDIPMLNDYKKMTVEMLSAHRSGITNDTSSGEFAKLWSELWQRQKEDSRLVRADVAQKILNLPPMNKPNSSYLYSNWNYILVGAIIERISGISWEDFIQQRLFSPLKMSSCGFGSAANPTAQTPDQPWPHRHLSDGTLQPLNSQEPADNPRAFGPAGTVHCSLEDWGIYLQTHLNGFHGQDSAILKASSYQKLHTAYPGQQYTPGGWMRVEDPQGPTLQHTGSNTLNYANVRLFLEKKLGFVAVTNTGDESFGFQITNSIISELLEEN